MNEKAVRRCKDALSTIQYQVTQQAATEAPFSGKLLHNKEEGHYCCIVCHQPLFQSLDKYDSGCGWPSFHTELKKGAIRYLSDSSHGMQRTEVRCASCDAHLGHIFDDGPTPTGQRFCINSASLSFIDNKKGYIILG